MANVLTVRANRREMLVFNLPNVFVQIVKCNCPNYIKTQPGMANVLTVRANRREMLVFNLLCTLEPI